VPIHDRIAAVPELPYWPGFAQVVTVSGKLAFPTTQAPLDSDDNLVGPGDFEAQAKQVLGNLQRILRSLGADWPDVVRLNWYVVAGSDLQALRAVHDELIRPALGDHPGPPGTLVQVAGLARPEFLIEVEAVAAVPD